MTANSATLDNFLTELNVRQSVLQGWTAALHLTETAVNQIVQSQWSALESKPVKAVWTNSARDRLQLGFQLGDPVVQLQAGHDSVLVRHAILDPSVQTGDAAARRLSAPSAYLESTVPVSTTVSGDEHSVVLNFAASSSAIYGINASEINAPAAAQSIGKWFADQNTGIPVTTVNFGNLAGVASLQPSSMKLNAIQTSAGNRILQILIATQGNQPTATRLDVGEPIPTESGISYSLIINSKAVVQDVIVPGYNKGTGQVKLVAAAPDSESGAWHAQTRNPMQYHGRISCIAGNVNTESQSQSGMNFLGTSDSGLMLKTYESPGNTISLQLSLSASYPITVSGSGLNQKIQLTATPASVAATGVAENAVKPQLEEFLNKDIMHDMTGISMDPVSSFALRSLSFPGHVPNMKTVQFPGDFVVVGTLEKESESASQVC